MYRPGKPVHGPPPFAVPPSHGPGFGLGRSCGPPPPHSSPGPCGPSPASDPDSHFLHSRPPRGHFISPQFSNFSIDCSTVIASGGSQQIDPHADPHLQVQQWNPTLVEHRLPDSSDRAGEEFLRCIAANKPLPDYLKGKMAYNLADAFKSAYVLRDSVKSDPEFQKSHSRSRSRGRSRRKSRAKSHTRSRSRICSQIRGRSKSQARGKSRARSKSRAKSNSRARSMSRSQSRSKKKSYTRSKSWVRRSKSQSSSSEKSYAKEKKRKRSPSHNFSSSVSSSNNLTGKSLLEGLKLVMNSKDLEERLPTLKDAILTIQASDEIKKVQCVPDECRHQQHYSQENSVSLENESVLLPHDRVGSDFSWLYVQSKEDSTARKADELDDEESFLYGIEDTGGKVDTSSTTLFAGFSQTGENSKLLEMDVSALCHQQHHQTKSIFSSFGDLLDLKQPLQITSPSLTSVNLESREYEKINNILKSMGTADIHEVMLKMEGQKEKLLSPELLSSDSNTVSLALPVMNNPDVCQALESLQSLIKATKEKRAKNDGSGTAQTSQTSDAHKASDIEERKREKQARISKMEVLMKELEGMMNQDGLSFLTPVIGFYCQKCEEFIGDLNSAENHAAIHRYSDSNSQKMQMGKHAENSEGHSHSFSSSSSNNINPHPSDRRDHMDYSCHRDSGDDRILRDYQQDWRGERDDRSKLNDDHRNHRASQENISLKEEMSKERMLITVPCGLTPPPNVRLKEQVSKEQTVGSYSKVKVGDTNNKDSRENYSKKKSESSDGTDDHKGKAPKVKSPKKKKKKKKDKKKKKKGDKS